MDKKISIEVNKKSKNNLLEWTKTIEIEYQKPKKEFSKEEKEILQQEIDSKNKNNKETSKNSILNTTILSMDGNPFYQPSMNTFEFNIENGEKIIQINFPKEEKEITNDQRISALDKLYKEDIISLKEYVEQKKRIL